MLLSGYRRIKMQNLLVLMQGVAKLNSRFIKTKYPKGLALSGLQSLVALSSAPTPDFSVPPPPLAEQSPQKRRRFPKKLFIVLAAVVTIIVVAVALFIPQGEASIPLNVDFVVGERMVYDTTVTASIPSSSLGLDSLLTGSLSVNGQQTIDVVDFDGEYYTLNHTATMELADYPTTTVSIIEKMNKTGYSTYIFDLGSAAIGVSSSEGGFGGYLAQLLSSPEVKVGDSITVPLPVALEKLGVQGSLILTFGGVQDLTVPAGTFKVFRIDMNSAGFQFDAGKFTNSYSENTPSISMTANMQCQSYMEYGTMRQIKSTMQESLSLESGYMNFTMNASMETVLQQDLRP